MAPTRMHTVIMVRSDMTLGVDALALGISVGKQAGVLQNTGEGDSIPQAAPHVSRLPRLDARRPAHLVGTLRVLVSRGLVWYRMCAKSSQRFGSPHA